MDYHPTISRRPTLPIVYMLWTIVAITVSTMVAISAMAERQPMLVIAAVLAAPLMLAFLTRPDFATLAVIFLLYTNFLVVAVRFHGVPSLVVCSILLVLCVPLAHHLVTGRQKLIFPSVLPLILAFVSIQMVGAVFARHPNVALGNLAISVFQGVALYFVITNLVRTPRMVRSAIWVLLVSGAFMGAVPLYQQITKTFGNDYGGFAQRHSRGLAAQMPPAKIKQHRHSGSIGEKNRYAQVMLMLVPLGFFQFRAESSTWLRRLAALATGLAVIGCALAFSRGAAVAFVLMLVVMAFIGTVRPTQMGVLLLGSIVLLVALPQYRTRLASLGSVLPRVFPTSGTGQPDGAIKGRLTEMWAAARVTFDYPLFGVGPGMFKHYSKEYSETLGLSNLKGNREAHNLYLHLAADHGLLGLGCFLAILFITIRNLARVRQRLITSAPQFAHMATGVMLALVVYMATGLFLHFSYVRYFWLMLALATSVVYVADRSLQIEVVPGDARWNGTKPSFGR